MATEGRTRGDTSEAGLATGGGAEGTMRPLTPFVYPDFTQELPRKLLPTRAKEPQRRRREKRQFTRRCLWPVGSSVDLKRADNPKVAGSNPAPATRESKGSGESLRSPCCLVASHRHIDIVPATPFGPTPMSCRRDVRGLSPQRAFQFLTSALNSCKPVEGRGRRWKRRGRGGSAPVR